MIIQLSFQSEGFVKKKHLLFHNNQIIKHLDGDPKVKEFNIIIKFYIQHNSKRKTQFSISKFNNLMFLYLYILFIPLYKLIFI